MDGWWWINDDYRHVSGFYRRAEDIDYGFIHELMHQLGVIDLYRMNIDVGNSLLPDANRPGHLAGCGTDYWDNRWECYRFSRPFNDVMGDAHPWIGPHTAGGLRSNSGHRRGFYGEYLYDTPEKTSIRVVDEDGSPLSNVALRFYQTEATAAGSILDAVAEFEVVTDSRGVAILPNRGITGIVTETGHQLKPNPFGRIDVVGRNGTFVIEMENPGTCINYEWLTLVELNLEYWSGNTESVTIEKTLRCPPPTASGKAPAFADGRGIRSSEVPPPYIPPGLDPPEWAGPTDQK